METYRCAYRDPHSPLTPLTPLCDITLRKNFRDHSPSLIPVKKIVLDDCPTPKRKRSAAQITNNNSSTKHQPCAVNIVISSSKTPDSDKFAKKSSYLQNLKRILTSNSRPTVKSIDLAPRVVESQKTTPKSTGKRSRFTCFQSSPSDRPIRNSPRVLKILQDIGQEKYSSVFKREEIDLDVFKLLTKGDLIQLGVEEENDILMILKAARQV